MVKLVCEQYSTIKSFFFFLIDKKFNYYIEDYEKLKTPKF